MSLDAGRVVLAIVAVASTVTLGQAQPDFSLRPVSLAGRLTDSTGAPIANATVTLKLAGAEGDVSTMRTLRDGRFLFPAKPNRTYTLRFAAPGFKVIILPTSTQIADVELKDVVTTPGSPGSDLNQSDDRSSDLLIQIRDDLHLRNMQDCVRDSGEVFEQMIRTYRVAVAVHHAGLVVEGLGPCFAGGNNGPLVIYAQFGSNWRKVFNESGIGIEPLPRRTHGFQDIARWQHDSAFASVRYTYHFDGNRYKVTGCNVVQFSDPLTDEQYRMPRYVRCSWNWKRSQR
jgi:hypothetical protein